MKWVYAYRQQTDTLLQLLWHYLTSRLWPTSAQECCVPWQFLRHEETVPVLPYMIGWNVRHTCKLQSGIWGIRLWRQQMSASIQSSTIRKKTFCYHCFQSKHFRAAFWNPLQLGTEGVTTVNAFTYVWPWLYLSLCNQNIRSVRRNCYRWRVVQTRFPSSVKTYKTCFSIYFWQ